MQVTDLSDVPNTSRELMLVKVRCQAAQRGELRDLAQIFHGNICDVSLKTVTLELQGKEDKMQALQRLLKPYGEKLSSLHQYLILMDGFNTVPRCALWDARLTARQQCIA